MKNYYDTKCVNTYHPQKKNYSWTDFILNVIIKWCITITTNFHRKFSNTHTHTNNNKINRITRMLIYLCIFNNLNSYNQMYRGYRDKNSTAWTNSCFVVRWMKIIEILWISISILCKLFSWLFTFKQTVVCINFIQFHRKINFF